MASIIKTVQVLIAADNNFTASPVVGEALEEPCSWGTVEPGVAASCTAGESNDIVLHIFIASVEAQTGDCLHVLVSALALLQHMDWFLRQHVALSQ